jgi:hypothetical protein
VNVKASPFSNRRLLRDFPLLFPCFTWVTIQYACRQPREARRSAAKPRRNQKCRFAAGWRGKLDVR